MALARYTPPVVEKPACASCKAMAPECLVPVDDGALAMCWVCAHMVTQHDAKLGATAHDCGCSSEKIYPHDYRARFARPQAPVSGELCSAIPRIVPEPTYTGYVRVTSPSYGLDGQIDRNGSVLVQKFEHVDAGVLRHSIEIREPDHGTKVARGMRAARQLRKLER